MPPGDTSPAPSERALVVRIGPLDAAARARTEHELENLTLPRLNLERLPFALPEDVADAFERLLREWRAVADATGDGEFQWSAAFTGEELERRGTPRTPGEQARRNHAPAAARRGGVRRD